MSSFSLPVAEFPNSKQHTFCPFCPRAPSSPGRPFLPWGKEQNRGSKFSDFLCLTFCSLVDKSSNGFSNWCLDPKTHKLKLVMRKICKVEVRLTLDRYCWQHSVTVTRHKLSYPNTERFLVWAAPGPQMHLLLSTRHCCRVVIKLTRAIMRASIVWVEEFEEFLRGEGTWTPSCQLTSELDRNWVYLTRGWDWIWV